MSGISWSPANEQDSTPATFVRPGVWTTKVEAPWTFRRYQPFRRMHRSQDCWDSPEIAALVSGLEATRWTRRPGYPLRSMVGMALAKSAYAVPTWTRTVALWSESATRCGWRSPKVARAPP